MKTSVGLLLGMALVLISFQSCKKETTLSDEWKEAKIIGQDLRLCACCGGWFITLEQDTVRTFGFPDEYELPSAMNLPKDVYLQYEEQTGPCSDFENLIQVKAIMDK